jgi:hypothetical protein
MIKELIKEDDTTLEKFMDYYTLKWYRNGHRMSSPSRKLMILVRQTIRQKCVLCVNINSLPSQIICVTTVLVLIL